VQLVQLQSAVEKFNKQGVKLAAISYDTEPILKYFSDRRKITFPLLADPDSQIIRAYGVLNPEGVGMLKGMALPGYFFIDPKGVIREKFFEAKYRVRYSGSDVIGKLFPELGSEVSGNVEAPHLRLGVQQSDKFGFPGSRITLSVNLDLPPDVHVYSPGVKGYKPIQLTMESSPDIEFTPATFPRPKILYLPAIKERVPVFEGSFTINQELKISASVPFNTSLGTDGKTVTIHGKLQYQACDTKVCYLPVSVPVEWQLQLLPLDVQRAPDDIRHK
jgi:hypothetical protein